MEPAPHRCSLDRHPDGAALLAGIERVRPALGEHLSVQRWFRSKGRRIVSVTLADGAPLPVTDEPEVAGALALIDLTYDRGPGESYLLPLAARPVDAARGLLGPEDRGLARLGAPDGDWLLYDGLDDPAIGRALLRHIEDAGDVPAAAGRFSFDRTPILSRVTGGAHPMPVRSLRRLRGEQSNTSIVCDDRLVLKVLRRLDNGENADLEVGRFLTLRTRFSRVPLVAGFARYEAAGAEPRTVALLTTFVPNAGDGWSWTLGRLRTFYGAAVPHGRPGADQEYQLAARRLGEVTGELHAALASDPADPAFAPEPVTPADLTAWSAAVEAQVASALSELGQLADRGATPPPGVAEILGVAADARFRIRRTVNRLAGLPLWKTRGHGDYHLGQVLRVAGDTPDFVILDFEGEPARSLAERRAKQPPLRDVAGMLRSFTYASFAGLFEATEGSDEAREALEPWRVAWERAASDAFMEGYLAATVKRGLAIVPAAPEARALLLSLFALERAAYELGYELNNRPGWLPIPLAAFRRELAA